MRSLCRILQPARESLNSLAMRLFPLVLPLFLLAAARAFPASYQNDALTRTYELGGSITTVTTTLSVRATTDEPGDYKLGLARKGEEGPVAWTVTLRGKQLGQVDAAVDSETGALVATVPSTLTKKDETLAIVVTEYFAYQSKPLPAAIDQDEKQFLQYSTDYTWPATAYPTKKMSIKYRAPRKILSHSKTPTTFLPSESTSLGFKLTGSSLNLGPYRDVPASIIPSSKVKKHALSVHYDTSEPVLAIEELRRFVEIGAWAGNLNFEDKILLRNAGPKLKGQFRKIDLMAAQYRPEFPAQVMRELTYPLTAGAVRPYYYDNTGNISTSHFRPSPPKGGKAILELSPRFPLLGGWKHEITVGWDVQLSEWLKSLGGDKKVLAVPFLTGLRGVVVDDAKLIVTLPEGAKDVQVVAPFPVDAIEHSTHKTYLDSTGRPRVTVSKKFAAESHEQDIYITYTYPFYANLQKPTTVSIACLFAFSLYWIVKRMDMSIASKKAIAVKVKHE